MAGSRPTMPEKRAISTSPSLTPPPITKPAKSPKRAKPSNPIESPEGPSTPLKKSRASAVKAKAIIEAEEEEDEAVDDVNPSKKARSGAVKAKAGTKDDDEEVESVKPAKKARTSAVNGKAKIKAEAEMVDDDDVGEDVKPAKKARKAKAKVKADEDVQDEDEDDLDDVKAVKKARTKKVKAEGEGDGDGPSEVKKPRQAKSKTFPPPDLDPSLHPVRQGHPPHPLPTLTSSPNGGLLSHTEAITRPHLLGAHTSIAGGPASALYRAGLAGANGLAMFLKSQRQWKSNPFEQESIDRFKEGMKGKEEGGLGYGAESILVHGSYLINLGNPDPIKWKTSYDCFKDDIYRCHQLGIKLYNWHPGSTVGACTKEESYASIAKAINQVHIDVPDVICVIENMANAKSNLIGTTFHDLASIIALVTDKSRVRICLDTCHLFAAGYDIRTPETYRETMKKFDEEVGNGYLAGVHMNDSKADLGGCKDLHENIGLGKIGLSAFRQIMRDPLMSGIPLILETPATVGNPLESGELAVWVQEIKMLYEIQGIEDADWEGEGGKCVEIEKRWRAERDRLSPPKEPKEKKVKEKKGKAKKGKKGEEEDEECESHGESE